MDIKNKFSKSKIDKRNNRLNKIMNIKKKIRKNTDKIIPLNKVEDFLYNTNMYSSEHNNFLQPKGKYLRLNNILLINTISKNDCEKLYVGIYNLYKDNYLKGYLGGDFREKNIHKLIVSYKILENNSKWSRICDISPKNKELYDLCDYVSISIFDISNDTIGIAFNMKMTDKFNKEIEKIYNTKIESKIIYDKHRYKNKWSYSISEINKNEVRNNIYEDYILEIKCRFNMLFEKYLPLQLNYKQYPPISLNIYQTNHNIKDKENRFFDSLNLIDDYFSQEVEDINVCIREDDSKKSDDFKKVKMYYEISISNCKTDRSNNIFFFIDNQKYQVISTTEAYINFISLTLTFYLTNEIKIKLSEEKQKLYKCLPHKIKKNFKQYEEFNKNFYIYKNIFNNIKICKTAYKDNYLEEGLKNVKKIYNECSSQYEKIKKEYEFRTNINNIKSSYILAKISIIIAIIAFVASVYFEYRDKPVNQNKTIINIYYKNSE